MGPRAASQASRSLRLCSFSFIRFRRRYSSLVMGVSSFPGEWNE